MAPAFPPNPTVGALRWRRLAPFLVDAGWELDVITLAPASLPAVDDAALDELPAGTRVYGVPMPVLGVQRAENALWGAWRRVRRPGPAAVRGAVARDAIAPAVRHGRRRQAARRAYFVATDYAVWRRWALRAARLAERLARDGSYGAIITSGPPHMVHEGGRRAAHATGLPLVLDFRDPWTLRRTLSEPVASPLWHRLAHRFEARAVRQAAVVIANTDVVCTRMRALYPGAGARFVTVMNGSDPEPLPRVERASRFTIAFAGTVYLDRDPRPLFAAAARVVRELGLTPEEFGIEMIGEVAQYGGVPTEALAREAGVGDHVTLGPPRSRQEALAFLARAAVLVSLPLDSELTVPAKIFDYVQFDAWLLVLAQPASATSALLAGTDADVVAPHDVTAIATALRRRYLEFCAGVRPTAVARDGRFSRAAQARVLVDALARAATAPHSPV